MEVVKVEKQKVDDTVQMATGMDPVSMARHIKHHNLRASPEVREFAQQIKKGMENEALIKQ